MERALIEKDEGGSDIAKYRISKSAWLEDHDHPKLAYLSRLLNAITKLSTESAELWQVRFFKPDNHY